MRRLVVLLLVVPLAACGGNGRLSKRAFEPHLQADGQKAKHASSVVASADAKRLAAARREMRVAAADLETIDPPKDAAGDTKTIAAGLRFLAIEMAKLQTAAAKHDLAAAALVAREVESSTVIAAASKAAKDLQRQGYDVGIFAK